VCSAVLFVRHAGLFVGPAGLFVVSAWFCVAHVRLFVASAGLFGELAGLFVALAGLSVGSAGLFVGPAGLFVGSAELRESRPADYGPRIMARGPQSFPMVRGSWPCGRSRLNNCVFARRLGLVAHTTRAGCTENGQKTKYFSKPVDG
jgi:hypothetical protein